MTSKKLVGEKATQWVKDGMIIGLGTGTTAYYAILKIGELVQKGLNIKAVPTSKKTEKLAKDCGINIVDLNKVGQLDITIDGADRVDRDLNLIKGGGGALFREKLVALNSKKLIIIADESKLVNRLGGVPLPIEVIPFGWSTLINPLKKLGLEPKLRASNNVPFITDNGNYIIDCDGHSDIDLIELDHKLKSLTGIIETGLFINIADTVLIGNDQEVRVLTKN